MKDIDIENEMITVRAAKGAKDRVVVLPKRLIQGLQKQMEHARSIHQEDVAVGTNRVEIPHRFSVKSPTAAGSLSWFWLFPSESLSRHPEEGWVGRYHIDKSNFGRSFKAASQRAQILKRCPPPLPQAQLCHPQSQPGS